MMTKSRWIDNWANDRDDRAARLDPDEVGVLVPMGVPVHVTAETCPECGDRLAAYDDGKPQGRRVRNVRLRPGAQRGLNVRASRSFGPVVVDDDGESFQLEEHQVNSALGATGGLLIALAGWDAGAHEWVTLDGGGVPTFLPWGLRALVRWVAVILGALIMRAAWRQQAPRSCERAPFVHHDHKGPTLLGRRYCAAHQRVEATR